MDAVDPSDEAVGDVDGLSEPLLLLPMFELEESLEQVVEAAEAVALGVGHSVQVVLDGEQELAALLVEGALAEQHCEHAERVRRVGEATLMEVGELLGELGGQLRLHRIGADEVEELQAPLVLLLWRQAAEAVADDQQVVEELLGGNAPQQLLQHFEASQWLCDSLLLRMAAAQHLANMLDDPPVQLVEGGAEMHPLTEARQHGVQQCLFDVQQTLVQVPHPAHLLQHLGAQQQQFQCWHRGGFLEGHLHNGLNLLQHMPILHMRWVNVVLEWECLHEIGEV